MKNSIQDLNQIHHVSNFHDLVSTSFSGNVNALCWSRKLVGDFFEIIRKIERAENITLVQEEDLRALQLSSDGQLAREILLNDLALLTNHGADPVINVIQNYDRDETSAFFPTDVYSFHVDRSPIPSNTFLCTYYGDASDILPNSEATQKIMIPEIREELMKYYLGKEEDFETFLVENFFDLHYQINPNAQPINLGLGNLWKLAIDFPGQKVLPCVHRAPKENSKRLMLIC
jgi:hypothetical protein